MVARAPESPTVVILSALQRAFASFAYGLHGPGGAAVEQLRKRTRAERVCELIRQHGSQRRAAEVIGVSEGTVRNWIDVKARAPDMRASIRMELVNLLQVAELPLSRKQLRERHRRHHDPVSRRLFDLHLDSLIEDQTVAIEEATGALYAARGHGLAKECVEARRAVEDGLAVLGRIGLELVDENADGDAEIRMFGAHLTPEARRAFQRELRTFIRERLVAHEADSLDDAAARPCTLLVGVGGRCD